MDKSVNYIEEIEFDTYEQLISDFHFGEIGKISYYYVFRGHGSVSYELLPSILRKSCKIEWQKSISKLLEGRNDNSELNQHHFELGLIKRFFDYCDEQGLMLPQTDIFRENLITPSIYMSFTKWIPKELHEITSLAQHYGLPTRLLDWTYDFLTALFFAVSAGVRNYDKDDKIVIWALHYTKMEEINWNSGREFPLKFITPPRYSNLNLSAQSGVLTLWESDVQKDFKKDIDRMPLDIKLNNELKKMASYSPQPLSFLGPFNMLKKITLPHTELKSLSTFLERLKYTESKIFPSYDGVVKRIKNKSFINYLDT
jgi:hypothetical protein